MKNKPDSMMGRVLSFFREPTPEPPALDLSPLHSLTTQEAQQLVSLCREEDLYLASFSLPLPIVKKMSFAYSGELKKRLMANLGRPFQAQGPEVEEALKRILENVSKIRSNLRQAA